MYVSIIYTIYTIQLLNAYRYAIQLLNFFLWPICFTFLL